MISLEFSVVAGLFSIFPILSLLFLSVSVTPEAVVVHPASFRPAQHTDYLTLTQFHFHISVFIPLLILMKSSFLSPSVSSVVHIVFHTRFIFQFYFTHALLLKRRKCCQNITQLRLPRLAIF